MQTLVALYHSFDKAQKAVDELVRNGISRDKISVVASDASGEYAKEYGTASPSTDDAVTSGQGAAFGAASGGVMGVLMGLGVLAIPGIGPVVAAGPLVAALTGGVLGVAAGAPTGGIVAALVYSNRLTQEEAEVYAEGIRRGDTLLTVESEDTETVKIREILDRYTPVDIRTQGEEFRTTGWKTFDVNAPPYDVNAVKAYRGRYQEAVTSSPNNDSEKTIPIFEKFDPEFRVNYIQNYLNSGRDYEEYRPVYRYGYEVATSPLYKDREWFAIENELRREWEKQNPETSWENFREVVHYAWDRVRNVKQPA